MRPNIYLNSFYSRAARPTGWGNTAAGLASPADERPETPALVFRFGTIETLMRESVYLITRASPPSNYILDSRRSADMVFCQWPLPAAFCFMLKKPEPISAAMRREPTGWRERMHHAIATH